MLFCWILTTPLTILVPSSLGTIFCCVYRPQGEQFGRGGGGVVVGGGGVGPTVGGGGQPKTTTICEEGIGELQASSNQNHPPCTTWFHKVKQIRTCKPVMMVVIPTISPFWTTQI